MLPPRRLTDDEANDVPTTWTPDSKAVLFYSDRNGTLGIFKREIGRDAAEVVVTGARDAISPLLSADGDWVLYSEVPTAAGPFPRIRLMRIPVGGGVPQFVLETKGRQDFGCARAPARLCWVSEASEDGKQLTLTAFDPQQGRGRVLRTIPQDPRAQFVGMAVSPDGTIFAVSRPGETEILVQLLSLLGGSDREIRVKGWPNLTGLAWSPDGKGLYLGSRSAQSSTLLHVDLKGSARVLWRFKAGGDVWGVPSPDGRYLAILGSVTNSNVWMLEGF
jgi:Tol biopolymer transport system component